jgi:hypothetical protein
VASDVTANRLYIRDGENGFLVGLLGQWEEKLSKLVDDPELRRRLGAQARESVERDYSIASAVPRYLALFERLCAAPKSARLTSTWAASAGMCWAAMPKAAASPKPTKFRRSAA